MSWDILPKANLQYFLSKLKAIFDTKAEITDVEGSKTATGSIIAVDDAADIYTEELSVDLEPIQDLHGYDKPWVGGGGKNKFSGNFSSNGLVLTMGTNYTNSDENAVLENSKTTSPNGYKYTTFGAYLKAGTYTLKNFTSDVYVTLNRYAIAGSTATSTDYHLREGGYTFTSSSDGWNWFSVERDADATTYTDINFDGKELLFQIEEGSSPTTTYAPYSNISPIQGYDIVSVDRCGKNLFNLYPFPTTADSGNVTHTINAENNSVSFHRNASSSGNHYYVSTETFSLPAGSYILSATVPNNSVRIGIQASSIYYVNNATPTVEFTLDETTECKLYLYYSSSYSADATISNAMIRLSSITDATFEKFNGQQVDVQVGNKNLLLMTVEGIKSVNTSGGTWNGNIFTHNNVKFELMLDSDGLVVGIKVTRLGTSSSASQLNILLRDIASGDYYYSGCADGGSGGNFDLYAWDNTSSARPTKWDGTTASVSVYNSTTSEQIKIDSSHVVRLICRIFSEYDAQGIVFKPMVRYSTVVDDTFSPYNPTLGGMIYGANLDVANGVMVIKKVTEIYNGSESEGWVDIASGASLYYRKPLVLPANVTQTEVMKCSHYERKAITSSNTDINVFNVLNASSGTIPAVAIRPDISVYTNTTLFKNYLAAQAQAGTPVQVSYYLLNPITIPLTPAQLKLLKGYNYISSNGTTIHLTYQPDNVIAQPKADVQRLRDYVDDRLVGNASKNIFDMSGFLNADGWVKNADGSYTGQRAKIYYNVYNATENNLHGKVGTLFKKGENLTATFTVYGDTKPRIYFGFNIRNSVTATERNVELDDIDNGTYTLTTNCSNDEFVYSIWFTYSGTGNITFKNFQIERGTTPTAYEEYYPSNRELWEMIKVLQS